MDFIDIYAGEPDPEKKKTAEWLGLRIAPGHFSLLVSSDHSTIRKSRKKFDLVAALVKKRSDLTQILTDTYYDFLIVPPVFRLGKRGVRMARRYETPLAVPLSPVFSAKQRVLRTAIYNLKLIQENNAQVLLCSGAEKAGDLRDGRTLAAVGTALGLRPDTSVMAVKHNPARVINRSKERMKQTEPGVRPL